MPLARPGGDPAIVYWEVFDSNGDPTGESGYVEIDEPGTVEITENGETTLTFEVTEGSLVAGNTLRVNTDADGTPDTLSDWHWTMDSFADEFNRSAGGVTATVSDDNTLILDTNEDYCAIDPISFSEADGVSEENTSIIVLNYTALEIVADDLAFTRTNGTWEIENDPTGSTMQILPEGGDDNGFMVDLDGDGLGDIQITFDQAVSGDGTIQMDLVSTDSSDFTFAFAGDEEGDSGLATALGLNTFFTGTDAASIGVNEVLADGDYIASGLVDFATGELAAGDNTNALAMSDTRNKTLSMKEWDYTRGEAATASLSETSLDDYEATLISAIGSAALNVQTSLDYAELMVYQLTNQRDSFSAISLDEEMIKLTAQQAAYSAAAKLLTAVDEMFATLLAIR